MSGLWRIDYSVVSPRLLVWAGLPILIYFGAAEIVARHDDDHTCSVLAGLSLATGSSSNDGSSLPTLDSDILFLRLEGIWKQPERRCVTDVAMG